MLQNDYIMRMIMDLVMSMRKAWNLPDKDRDTALDDVERAVGEAVGVDSDLFFSMDPESMISMMNLGDVDDDLALYVSRAIFYEAKVLEAEGKIGTASLRRKQAIAIAQEYGCPIPSDAESAEGLIQLFMEDPQDGPAEGTAGEQSDNSQSDNIQDSSEQTARKTPDDFGLSISGISLDKLKFDD